MAEHGAINPVEYDRSVLNILTVARITEEKGLNIRTKPIDGEVIKAFEKGTELEIVSEKDGIVRTFVGGDNREVAHPSYQAWSYKMLLKDFNQNIQENNIIVSATKNNVNFFIMYLI